MIQNSPKAEIRGSNPLRARQLRAKPTLKLTEELRLRVIIASNTSDSLLPTSIKISTLYSHLAILISRMISQIFGK